MLNRNGESTPRALLADCGIFKAQNSAMFKDILTGIEAIHCTLWPYYTVMAINTSGKKNTKLKSNQNG